MSKVCLITGVGPGTGSALTRKFSNQGYRVAMLARSEDRLRGLEQEIEYARAYPCDVADIESLEKTVSAVKTELGAPNVVIHNAVGGAYGSFLDIDPAVLEHNFQINTMALLHLARLTAEDMLSAKEGVILCTGNTAAYRGKANFASFSPTKAAQRILLESIARELGPQGVHAVYVAIDAVIDVPWTRARFADKPDDFFANPDEIASVCYDVAHQPRSAWSSEITIRPFAENW